ncbi:MAG: efflux RND transporter permease subunit [Candidatus Hydrogenedentes bacterium]|nr:efflux RND transporter permease subunit [Candidatus Hydrogenedentota bacterium]
MDIIKTSIENPVSVIVGVLLVTLFGIISLLRMPYQLAPRVEEPVIEVETTWPGATPYEIERDIVEEQEKVLKGIPGLYEMESSSFNSRASIDLRFTLGTDIDEALLRVSNKLDEVPEYPENVDKPVVNAQGTETSPVVWMVMRTREGNPEHIYHYLTYFENEIRQHFERIDGVADLWSSGGVEKQMQVLVEPDKLAAHQLTIDSVIGALRAENANVSAGLLGVGRRDIRIRTVAEFRSVEDIRDVVLRSDGERRVTVGDVAHVEIGYQKLSTPTFADGEPAISCGISPEPGVNVLELTDKVEAVFNELNEGKLKDAGLELEWVSDQRPYINGAIELVRHDVIVGGWLAVAVLLIFLRSVAPTLVVSSSIPICIIGTFIFIYSSGGTLNVVSLAGLAFSVGMFVDNSIVVLENIDRHRLMGKSPADSAYEGTKEVWGAVVASSLTNVAVFLPIVFLQQEAGQLFREIAVAISAGVMISLLVCATVIPALSKQVYSWRIANRLDLTKSKFDIFGKFGAFGTAVCMKLLHGTVMRNSITRVVSVVALTGAAGVATYLMFPKMEYLPEGNRDIIFNQIIPPPGLSYEARAEIGRQFYEYLKPYYQDGHEGYPAVGSMFFMGRGSTLFCIVRSADPARARELVPLCQKAIASIPSVFGVSSQASILQSGRGRGRAIDVDISGEKLEDLIASASALRAAVLNQITDSQVRPRPALEVMFPEVRFVPSRDRLRAVGMTAQQLGTNIDVLMDGREIGDYKQEGEKKIDLVLKVADVDVATPEEVSASMIATPLGTTIPVSSLADLVETQGMTELRHLERNRTITLSVTPPFSITIQEAMEKIQDEIVPALRDSGQVKDVDIFYSGTADKLLDTRNAVKWNFLLAAMITYLLMAALYGNFIYPLIIMFTVPLAGAGGFLGLMLVNRFIHAQSLDILTMLGFIILVGAVVNNAILIVHQALNNIRIEGMDYDKAIEDSVRTRLRPIYMSATTSCFGMLPLILWPGPGSELYRGIGAVVIGGIALSTVVTVFLIPPMLSWFIRMEKRSNVSNQKSPGFAATETVAAK